MGYRTLTKSRISKKDSAEKSLKIHQLIHGGINEEGKRGWYKGREQGRRGKTRHSSMLTEGQKIATDGGKKGRGITREGIEGVP